ncbi:MAG: HEAT repeat domain-containing protein [Solirubrobacteraceae bacterium]
MDFLLEFLTDTDWLARSAGAQNLGELRDPRAVTALTRCLQAADDGLRISALKALAKIGDPSVVPEVFEAATGDESFGVRATAAETLGRLGDRRAIGVLARMLTDPSQPCPQSYFKWGTRLLVELDGVEAIGDLERATPSAGLRRRMQLKRTIRALRNLEDKHNDSR